MKVVRYLLTNPLTFHTDVMNGSVVVPSTATRSTVLAILRVYGVPVDSYKTHEVYL